jgi:hypothetical protein
MNKKHIRIVIFAAAFVLMAGIPGCFLIPDAAGKASGVYTPSRGSTERREILDAVRLKIKELHELDVIFVVKTLKVSCGWAWVHTLPRSKDGSGRYEDFYALMQKKQGRWTIAEIPCTETDNPDCMDSPGYFRKLARHFPGLPPGILPVGTLNR